MNLQTALHDISEKKVSPLYLLVGTEAYLAERFKQVLTDEVIGASEDFFTVASFDMEEVPLNLAIAEAQMIPFFGTSRLIFITHPYFLTTEKKTSAIEHDFSDLFRYLEQPNPSTILVFYANVDKLDERKKITKELKKKATFIDISPMKEKEVSEYTRQTITQAGYTITPEAFQTLLARTDMHVSRLMNELQKLFLFHAKDKKITLTSVKELVAKSLAHNVFDLTNEIISGRTEQALRLYEELIMKGEDPIGLNAILLTQMRLFVQVKMFLEIGYQQANIAEMLHIHPYRVKLATQQVKRFRLPYLATVFDELVENDYQMKTGQLDKYFCFELFILKFSTNKKP